MELTKLHKQRLEHMEDINDATVQLNNLSRRDTCPEIESRIDQKRNEIDQIKTKLTAIEGKITILNADKQFKIESIIRESMVGVSTPPMSRYDKEQLDKDLMLAIRQSMERDVVAAEELQMLPIIAPNIQPHILAQCLWKRRQRRNKRNNNKLLDNYSCLLYCSTYHFVMYYIKHLRLYKTLYIQSKKLYIYFKSKLINNNKSYLKRDDYFVLIFTIIKSNHWDSISKTEIHKNLLINLFCLLNLFY